MIERLLNLSPLLENKSHFLFGPRQTGKSSLIRAQLPQLLIFNLLESDTFAKLSARPALLRESVKQGQRVVIDEIQKLPILLDEVQLLIEERSAVFLLTGSSSRKLRRSGTNLLGGRARSRELLPLSSAELQGQFDLDRALNRGLLPSIYFSDSPEEDLAAYVGDYLRQEIAAEAIVRNVPAYSRFLQVASLFSARQVNIEKLAADAQLSPSTVRNYFQILQDTLLGHVLPPWHEGGKAREVATAKFYLFDSGVCRRLQGRGLLAPRTPEYGEAFESFIHHELRCFIAYRSRDTSLHFWRTHAGAEVDFILGDSIGIEVKASANVLPQDLRGLRVINEHYKLQRRIVVCLEPRERSADGITIMPWSEFLAQLWQGTLIH